MNNIARFVSMLAAPLAVVALTWPARAAEPDVAAAWADIRRFRFEEVAEALADISPADRPAALARAHALLNRQPRTDSGLARAESLFAALATGSDDIAAEAAFALARLPDVHLLQPDPGLALHRYRDLAESRPEHPLGQRARLHALLLEAMPASNESPAPVAELLRWEAGFTLPDTRRDFHLFMTDVFQLREHDDAAAYEHLVAALAIGLNNVRLRVDQTLRAGELARRLGRHADAATHYRAFLADARRDPRSHLVQLRLDGLPVATTSPRP